MTHPNNLAYLKFVKLFTEANLGVSKSKQMLQSEAMTFWKTNIRKSLKEQPDKDALEQKMVLLREKIDKKKRKYSIKLVPLNRICLHHRPLQPP